MNPRQLRAQARHQRETPPVVVNEPVIFNEPVVINEPVIFNESVVVNEPVVVAEPLVLGASNSKKRRQQKLKIQLKMLLKNLL